MRHARGDLIKVGLRLFIRSSTLPPLPPTHTRDGVRRERGGRSPVLSPASFDGSSRGHQNAELHIKFRRHPHLSPSRVLACHPHNQFTNLTRQGWSAWLRLPAPEKPEPLPMPTDDGVRLDDHESTLPVAPRLGSVWWCGRAGKESRKVQQFAIPIFVFDSGPHLGTVRNRLAC